MLGTIRKSLALTLPMSGHKPWPRYDVEPSNWGAIAESLGEGVGDLMGMWSDGMHVFVALQAEELGGLAVISLRIVDDAYPAVGPYHPAAVRLERTIRDLHGIDPVGLSDRRSWLDHGAWGVRAPLGERSPADLRDPAAYNFLPVSGEGLHEIPVGPVHAGIIEPGHFRFTANGETIARLEERLGYAHKGIDGLLNDVELDRAAKIVGRVSGDSTVAYSFAFARAVEAALDVDVPARAVTLRGVMAELERIANHLGDIGAICNDAAFALIHAQCGILRESVLATCDSAFGHRLMMDCIVPGGLEQDMYRGGARLILDLLDAIAPRFAEVVEVYDNTPSLQNRTCGTGIVSAELVKRYAAGGYVGRASGRNFDARRDLPYPPYDRIVPEVPVLTEGDVNARVWIRIREIEESMRLLPSLLSALSDGPVRVPVPGAGLPREGVAVVEAFRGDVLVWARVKVGPRLARCHVRDASAFQWPLLEAAIENNIVADFPLCNKSFNCSYSGHDV